MIEKCKLFGLSGIKYLLKVPKCYNFIASLKFGNNECIFQRCSVILNNGVKDNLMIQFKKYSFSFTGASALIAETMIIAEEFDKLKNWKGVEISILDKNLLNKTKNATIKRELTEIKKRLSSLTPDQLQLLINGSLDDAKAMILLSLVNTYDYLKDFIVEVVRNKYLMFDRVLTETDYNRFFNSKCLSHPELNTITELTASKVKQVIFKLLAQMGIITHPKKGIILKPILSKEVLDVIAKEDPLCLASFLYSNEEINILINKKR